MAGKLTQFKATVYKEEYGMVARKIVKDLEDIII